MAAPSERRAAWICSRECEYFRSNRASIRACCETTPGRARESKMADVAEWLKTVRPP
jgi:hypothetical protein